MIESGRLVRACAGLLLAVAVNWLIMPATEAQNLVKEWSQVQIPPMPDLKSVSVDPTTTVFFMISMTQDNCNPKRPRCLATISLIAKLLGEARDHHLLVIHSLTRGGSQKAQLIPDLAPRDGEPLIPAGPGPDKFIGSNLDDILKEHGIKTVIVVGTQAETAILHTGAGAAFRGYNVVVPIDGMSSNTAFPELYTAYHLATTFRIAEFVALTETDKISFAESPK
jgi:nicotinamidase-related amidase